MRNQNTKSLLVEVLLAILFFSLASTVILQVFVAARNTSVRAGQLDSVLAVAQHMADEYYLTGEVDATMEVDGVCLSIRGAAEATTAGQLRRAEVIAEDAQGQMLFVLPCTRYLPMEETP